MKIAPTNSPARLSQDQAAGLYDRLAGVYDIWGKLTERTARNRALELADIRDGENVLEIAAGTGQESCVNFTGCSNRQEDWSWPI